MNEWTDDCARTEFYYTVPGHQGHIIGALCVFQESSVRNYKYQITTLLYKTYVNIYTLDLICVDIYSIYTLDTCKYSQIDGCVVTPRDSTTAECGTLGTWFSKTHGTSPQSPLYPGSVCCLATITAIKQKSAGKWRHSNVFHHKATARDSRNNHTRHTSMHDQHIN